MSHASRSQSSVSTSSDSSRAAVAEEEDVEIEDSSPPNEDSSSAEGPSNSRQRHDSGDSWSSGVPEGPDIVEEDIEAVYMENPRDEQNIPDPVIRPVRPHVGVRSRPAPTRIVRPPFEIPTFTGQVYNPVPKKPHIVRPQTSKESCKLIVDYLISEGYKEVAETLCKEAGIDIPIGELRHLDGRVAIREAIINGNMEEAIKLVKKLCPGLMESHSEVRFNLHQQRILELIRAQEVDQVLEYAEEHISQDEELQPLQLDRLERTFALLAFDDPKESPFSNLLNLDHRQQISTEINSAVLRYQNRPAAPRLEALLRMIVWAEKQICEKQAGSRQHLIDASQLSTELFGMAQFGFEVDTSDLGTSI